MGHAFDGPALRGFAGVEVRVLLDDGSCWTGRLRTDLLGARAVSVYLAGDGEGVTLDIAHIAEVVPLSPPSA